MYIYIIHTCVRVCIRIQIATVLDSFQGDLYLSLASILVKFPNEYYIFYFTTYGYMYNILADVDCYKL